MLVCPESPVPVTTDCPCGHGDGSQLWKLQRISELSNHRDSNGQATRPNPGSVPSCLHEISGVFNSFAPGQSKPGKMNCGVWKGRV